MSYHERSTWFVQFWNCINLPCGPWWHQTVRQPASAAHPWWLSSALRTDDFRLLAAPKNIHLKTPKSATNSWLLNIPIALPDCTPSVVDTSPQTANLTNQSNNPTSNQAKSSTKISGFICQQNLQKSIASPAEPKGSQSNHPRQSMNYLDLHAHLL